MNRRCACSVNDTLVCALQRTNEKLATELIEQSRLLARLLDKAIDAALLPREEQFSRIQIEKESERPGSDMPTIPPIRRPPDDDTDAVATVHVPSMSGGMGA